MFGVRPTEASNVQILCGKWARDVANQITEQCVSAGQPKHRQELTEEVVNFLRPTEGPPQDENHMDQSQEEAKHPGRGGQDRAHTPAHDDRVMEGVADGHIPIIGHRHQNQALCVSKSQKQISLHKARDKGDGSILVH